MIEAHGTLERPIAGVTDQQLAETSALSGWPRGHVLAHLTDNARMFARLAEHALCGDLVAAHDGGVDERNAIIEAHGRPHLLPEADLAIAEAAARLVPRARATSENTASGAEPEPGGAVKPGPESVPDDADPSGDIREINSPSAHVRLTQTASDEESEAE